VEKHIALSEILTEVSHRPWPLPKTHWAMTQRWNDLLFAHWPVPTAAIADQLPEGLVLDTFDGSSWISIVPFWMDAVRLTDFPILPRMQSYPELHMRTYVRERYTNARGLYFFSLDAARITAVVFQRLIHQLPYYWARIYLEHRNERECGYQSERLLTTRPVRFKARYRGMGPTRRLVNRAQGSLEHFLTERYCLFVANIHGRLLRGEIHHAPWPLEEAEAEIELNELPAAHGISLPDTKPLLHYSRELVVYLWQTELVQRPSLVRLPGSVTAAKSL
jgi:uncharacterized protein